MAEPESWLTLVTWPTSRPWPGKRGQVVRSSQPSSTSNPLHTAAENTSKWLFYDLGLSLGPGESQASALWHLLMTGADSVHALTLLNKYIHTKGCLSETLPDMSVAAGKARLRALLTLGREWWISRDFPNMLKPDTVLLVGDGEPGNHPSPRTRGHTCAHTHAAHAHGSRASRPHSGPGVQLTNWKVATPAVASPRRGHVSAGGSAPGTPSWPPRRHGPQEVAGGTAARARGGAGGRGGGGAFKGAGGAGGWGPRRGQPGARAAQAPPQPPPLGPAPPPPRPAARASSGHCWAAGGTPGAARDEEARPAAARGPAQTRESATPSAASPLAGVRLGAAVPGRGRRAPPGRCLLLASPGLRPPASRIGPAALPPRPPRAPAAAS